MSANSGIEWTQATWNPVIGCTRVSEGCRHCYAEGIARRWQAAGVRGYDGVVDTHGRWTGRVNLVESALEAPPHWRRPRRVFVNSMSDLFHETVPDEWIDRVLAVVALCPQHTFQVLTKRPERMVRYYDDVLWEAVDKQTCKTVHSYFKGRRYSVEQCMRGIEPGAVLDRWPLENLWVGVSAEDQKSADDRIPWLFDIPAAVRFVSLEPLLGPIDLRRLCIGDSHYIDALEARAWDDVNGELSTSEHGEVPMDRGLDWVVAGGESGPGARPMHPDWARSLRDQCVAAGVPFFFKQWGEWGLTRQERFFEPIESGYAGKLVAMRLVATTSSDKSRIDAVTSYRAYPKSLDGVTHVDSMERIGKKAAGRLLDGREWNEYPKSTVGV